jgi:hypothetical protein
VGLGLIDPEWVGFHIALKVFPFLSQRDVGCQGRANADGPKNLKVWTAGPLAFGDPIGGH